MDDECSKAKIAADEKLAQHQATLTEWHNSFELFLNWLWKVVLIVALISAANPTALAVIKGLLGG